MRTFILLLTTLSIVQASDVLFDAARKGDVAAVKAALDGGASVDATWRYGQTALFIAAGRGHSEVVALLLSRGANPNVKDTFYGMTALQGAAQKSDIATIQLLLDKGATGADQLLVRAAGSGNAALAKALLARPGWTADTLTNALSAAEAAKHSEVAGLLKEAGAKPRETVSVEAPVLEKYAGVYKRGTEELKVETTGGKLRIGGAGLPMMDCRMIEATVCEPAQFAGAMTIAFTSEGIEVRQGPRTEKFLRGEAGK